MKQIKLSETHYIIVDDSEIKENDYVIFLDGKLLYQVEYKSQLNDYNADIDCKKITHSTPIGGLSAMLIAGVKELSLSEVEELIYGYSVEKMAEEKADEETFIDCSLDYVGFYKGYIKGFNAHKELVKDKLFTAEDLFNYSQMICEKLPQLKKLQTSQADDYGNNLTVILKIQDEAIQSLHLKIE